MIVVPLATPRTISYALCFDGNDAILTSLYARERETIQLFQQETPDSISPDLWPPNSPDLNQVD